MPDIDTLRPMYGATISEYPGKIGESSKMGATAAMLPVQKTAEGKVARKFPEEEDEELLRESEDRFVLFPIKYREVSLSALTGMLGLS